MRRNVLTAHHLAERLHWCQGHSRRRREQWRTLHFPDESRFMLVGADGRFRIYRRHNERYATNCVLHHDRLGGGSVMVWSVFRHDGRTALVNVN